MIKQTGPSKNSHSRPNAAFREWAYPWNIYGIVRNLIWKLFFKLVC